MTVETGICPLCEAVGSVGEPCRGAGCTTAGYHFIPRAQAELALSAPERLPPCNVGRKIGDYLAIEHIRSGYYGMEYQAIGPQGHRGRSLTVLDHSTAHEDKPIRILTVFEDEVGYLRSINHAAVPRIMDIGVHQGHAWIARTRVVRGMSLSRFLGGQMPEGGPLTDVEFHRLVHQVAYGLDAIHRQGWVHEQLQPGYVIFRRREGAQMKVDILEFAVAKLAQAHAVPKVQVGALHYFAPEQLSKGNSSPESDLYALVAMVFEMLTGRRPFDGPNPVAVMARKLEPSYDHMQELEGLEVAPTVREFFARGLARDPQVRFHTADELWDMFHNGFNAFRKLWKARYFK